MSFISKFWSDVSKTFKNSVQSIRKYFFHFYSPSFHCVGAMATHPGLIRKDNEDSIAYAIFDGATNTRSAGLLGIVADGMGGHAHGEIASRIAVETIMRLYSSHPKERAKAILIRGFEEANRIILEQCEDHPELRGMGTTCTALAIEAGCAVLVHIGDSRAYYRRKGQIFQMSEDHSLVSQLVRDGLISNEEAAVHPDRNVIVKALGIATNMHQKVYISRMAVESGDIFCLCSDGLSNLVDIEKIGAAISALDPPQACNVLRDTALEAGGHDNISIGVFRVFSINDDAPVFRSPVETKSRDINKGAE